MKYINAPIAESQTDSHCFVNFGVSSVYINKKIIQPHNKTLQLLDIEIYGSDSIGEIHSPMCTSPMSKLRVIIQCIGVSYYNATLFISQFVISRLGLGHDLFEMK